MSAMRRQRRSAPRGHRMRDEVAPISSCRPTNERVERARDTGRIYLDTQEAVRLERVPSLSAERGQPGRAAPPRPRPARAAQRRLAEHGVAGLGEPPERGALPTFTAEPVTKVPPAERLSRDTGFAGVDPDSPKSKADAPQRSTLERFVEEPGTARQHVVRLRESPERRRPRARPAHRRRPSPRRRRTSRPSRRAVRSQPRISSKKSRHQVAKRLGVETSSPSLGRAADVRRREPYESAVPRPHRRRALRLVRPSWQARRAPGSCLPRIGPLESLQRSRRAQALGLHPAACEARPDTRRALRPADRPR